MRLPSWLKSIISWFSKEKNRELIKDGIDKAGEAVGKLDAEEGDD